MPSPARMGEAGVFRNKHNTLSSHNAEKSFPPPLFLKSMDAFSLRDLAKFVGIAALAGTLFDQVASRILNGGQEFPFIFEFLLLAVITGFGMILIGVGRIRGMILVALFLLYVSLFSQLFPFKYFFLHSQQVNVQMIFSTNFLLHFIAIYLGYLIAMWLWQRSSVSSSLPFIGFVAVLAVAMAAAAWILNSLIDGHLPSIVLLLIYVLIATPFLILWWSLVGRDKATAIGGGVILSLLWFLYSQWVYLLDAHSQLIGFLQLFLYLIATIPVLLWDSRRYEARLEKAKQFSYLFF